MRLNNKWITSAAVVFIFYTAFTARYKETKNTVSVDTITSFIPTKEEAKKTIQSLATTDVGKTLITKAFLSDGPLRPATPEAVTTPKPRSQMPMMDSVKGEGRAAACGQTVKVHYKLSLPEGKKLDSTHDSNHPVTFTIGQRKVIRGIELGVVGMQKGGIRKLAISPSFAYDDPLFANSLVPSGSTVIAELQLVELLALVSKTETPISLLNKTPGSGKPALCGDRVVIRYAIRNSATKTPDKAPVGIKEYSKEFVLGDQSIPVGLIEAATQMQEGERRTFSLPATLLSTTIEGKPTASMLAPGQRKNIVYLDIKMVKIVSQ